MTIQIRILMNKKMKDNFFYDACVIGAGASGLAAASELASRGYRTVLIEQNKKSGRKLYATGNGRCNLANAVLSDSAYYGNLFAKSVVSAESVQDLTDWLEGIGIPLTEKNGYLYPKSLQASSVVWALTDAARLAGAEFLYDTKVTEICSDSGRSWIIKTEGTAARTIRSERLVLSMGSPAARELGAAKDTELYSLFENLSLEYRAYQPALCPLETEEDVRSLAGVRAGCRMMLLHGDSREEEDGEVQFTEYGISGIVTFNLATLADVKDTVLLNLLPEWDSDDELLSFLRGQSQRRSAFGAFNGILHEKVISYAFEHLSPGKGKRALSEWQDQELIRIIGHLGNMPLTVSGKKGDQGQAACGGVLCRLLDPDTMQVKGRPTLAITGEVTDVVGRCGGSNLMYALISGLRAGRNL